MIVRPVRPGDRQALRRFVCSDGSPVQNRLQTWIRAKAYGWSRASVNNHLKVLVGDDNRIYGMYGYEPGDYPDLWFVPFVAVARESHGAGYGTQLLMTCLDELTELEPDDSRAYWKVLHGNEASHVISRRVGAVPDPVPEFAKHTTYFIAL